MSEKVKINESFEKLNELGKKLGKLGKNFQDVLEKEWILILAEQIKSLCKDLGIPIVSSVEELKSYPIVIFPSYHDHYDTEPQELKEILYHQILSSYDGKIKKTILGFEFYSDKSFEDLLNDPARNLHETTYLSGLKFKKIFLEFLKVFNEIQHKYSIDRFEIKVFGDTYAESVERQKAENMGDTEKVKEFDEKNYAKIVKSILDLLKTHEDYNLVFWTGMLHVIDLLTMLKEIIKSGNKEGINIDKIAVYLSPRDQSLSDYEQFKLKLLNCFISIMRK